LDIWNLLHYKSFQMMPILLKMFVKTTEKTLNTSQ